MIGAHTLPEDNAHVRFDVDLDDARREAVRGGAVFGSFLGLGIGIVGALITDGVPGTIGDISQIVAIGSGMAAGVAGGISTAASRFRNRVFAAKMELTGLLDRLERGDRLDPPPAPWRRKLQLRLFGDRN
jgi:hypothetical protein